MATALCAAARDRSLDSIAAQCKQDFLLSKDFLSWRGGKAHEKLASMSIHLAIKQRRKHLKLTQAQLAARVSELEGLKKPLTGPTVQQWENGASAPKRTRLSHVATALETTVEELLRETSLDSTPPQEKGPSLDAWRTKAQELAKVLDAEIGKPFYSSFIHMVDAALASQAEDAEASNSYLARTPHDRTSIS